MPWVIGISAFVLFNIIVLIIFSWRNAKASVKPKCLTLEIDLPSQISDFMTGLSIGVGYGMVVLGVIMTSRYAKKIRDFKRRIAGLDKGKSE